MLKCKRKGFILKEKDLFKKKKDLFKKKSISTLQINTAKVQLLYSQMAVIEFELQPTTLIITAQKLAYSRVTVSFYENYN